jgi:hypothetical protein
VECACTCLNSTWFEIQIKYLLFIGSDLSPKDSPASGAAPETQAGASEVAPTPSPGVSGSSVLTTSAGFLLIVGLAVASFSSFWADGSVNFLGQKEEMVREICRVYINWDYVWTLVFLSLLSGSNDLKPTWRFGLDCSYNVISIYFYLLVL